MPLSPSLSELRERLGSRLLLVPGVAALIHDDAGRVLILQSMGCSPSRTPVRCSRSLTE